MLITCTNLWYACNKTCVSAVRVCKVVTEWYCMGIKNECKKSLGLFISLHINVNLVLICMHNACLGCTNYTVAREPLKMALRSARVMKEQLITNSHKRKPTEETITPLTTKRTRKQVKATDKDVRGFLPNARSNRLGRWLGCRWLQVQVRDGICVCVRNGPAKC